MAARKSPAMNQQTRDILLAFVISIILHLGFLSYSTQVKFGDFGMIDIDEPAAFHVKIQPEEESRRRRKPRPDIEAEQREQIRKKLVEQTETLPDIPVPPPIDLQEAVPENRKAVYDQQLREKASITTQEVDPRLPDLFDKPPEGPVDVNLLQMPNAVSQSIPEPARQAVEREDGNTALAQASEPMSRLPASGPPLPESINLAAAPPPVLEEIEAPVSAGILPPKPIIDISRHIEKPVSVPEVYIAPDPEKISRFIPLQEFLAVELTTYHLPDDPRGFFLVRIRPNERSTELPVMSKDIVFVLDASASMGRRTLMNLKAGLKLCLSKIQEDDLFNVIGFKRNVESFEEGLVPANPNNIQNAIRFVGGLESSGRTDIYGSLEPISRLARGADHPFIIWLFSDGRPNVGVVDSRTIINNLSDNVEENTSIFAFGAGNRMNKYLLDLLSYRNKGFVDFAEEYDEIVPQIEIMAEALADPLLINLTSDYSNIDESEIYPRVLPDLYRGGEIQIFGRYRNQKKFSLRILGEAKGQSKEFIIELPFPEEDNGSSTLPQQWAFRKIYHLIGQMSQYGETPQRLGEIQMLSEQYGVRTPYYE